MNKIRKKIFLFCLLCTFVLTGLTSCGEDGIKVNSANALAKKLASGSAVKINVSKDIILDEPIVVRGEKEIVGNGKIVAAAEDSEELYMITVADGGKLTVGGSVDIDAAGLMGAIHVQKGGTVVVQDKSIVMNASKEAANVLNEGSLEVAGGSLKDAKGHNIYNKEETVISGGEITGSGEKYAGVYNEGTLSQTGGNITKAYNNVSNMSGSVFTFEGGTNTKSIRDGVFVAEGATLKATKKEATIENTGARGILLQGQADIKMITVKGCGDTLIKVSKSGVLNLGNGILQEGNYHGVDNAGTMNMLGGTVQMNANCGIVNTGTLKVTSGNIANNANKGILNKHEGKADVTSAMVTFTANKTAIANEDKAVFEFAKAKIMMSTQTNIYCYDGIINVHDVALNASTSNNVRIINGEINMTNVEVKGNSQSSNTSHHGIYMEGGVINAENVTVSMTTGNGIRNKGGVFKGKNIVMHDINRVAISQGKHDYLDVEGLTEINNLGVQSTNYANIWNEGGGTIKITDGKLAVASSNSIRVNDGLVELSNVTIPGHKEGSKDNIHGIYLEGGEIVAKKVTITNTSGNALRNKNGKFTGKNIKISNVKGQSAIWNLPLDEEHKNGIIHIDGLTIKNSFSKNITLDCGVTTIKNATLGASGANNIKMQNNDATLKIYNVKIQGQKKDATANTHGIMIEGGHVYGEGVQIADTIGSGIRCKMGTVNLKDVAMTNLAHAGISNSKMVKDEVEIGTGNISIDGLTITKPGTNNVVVDAGKVTLTNAVLDKIETENHNIKVTGTGKVTLIDSEVKGTTADNKYGIIAEGGDVVLKNVKISDLAKSALHANQETSSITGENVTIEKGKYGVTGSNGEIVIKGLKISDITDNNILAQGNLVVKTSNADLGKTNGHNVKIADNAIVTINKGTIKGVTDSSKYGIIAEGGDAVLTDVSISNVNNAGIRINRETSSVSARNITITDSNSGVTGTNGIVTINGFTTKNIVYNNVVVDGESRFTIVNADLGKVTGDGHNVKVAGNAKLVMTAAEIKGTTSDSKYGVIAEGGDAVLKDVNIYNLAKSGIHANKETSEVKGTNVTITNGKYGITGSNGNITIDNLKTSDITDNNILADSKLTVTLTNAKLGLTTGHNVKMTANAVVTLTDSEIMGVTDGDKHGIMAEGGDAVLKNVTIKDVKNTAIRINNLASTVTGEDVTIKDSANGVTGTNGTVAIDGLTTENVTHNNVVASGSANFTIQNATLCKVTADAHNVKVEQNAKLKMADSVINGTTSDSKYGIIAEGGEADLKNIKINDVAKSGIHANKESSIIVGKNITVSNGVYAITGSAGNIDIEKLKTLDVSESNISVSGTCNVTVTKSSGGYGLCATANHNVKAIDDALVTLDTVEVKGVTTVNRHGVLAEGGDVVLNNVSIRDVEGAGIRINRASSEITGKKVVIKNSENAITGTAGVVVIDGLTTSRITNNNVLTSGSDITVKNGELGNTSGHSIKSETNGKVTLETTTIKGVTASDKYGVMAEGGYVKLDDVTIRNVVAAAIRSNRETSVVEGSVVEILKSGYGVSASAGNVTIDKLTSNAKTSNVTISGGTALITNSELNKTGDSNVTLSGGTVNLKGEIVVNGASEYGIYQTGGTINGKDATSIVIKNATKTGIYGTAGKIEASNVNISGSGKNVLLDGTAVGTLDNATLGATTEENVKISTDAEITLNNATLDGKSGKGDYILCAEGKKAVLKDVTLVDKTDNGHVALWVKNSCEVQGTDVIIGNVNYGIIANGNSTVNITGLTANAKLQNIKIDAKASAKVAVSGTAKIHAIFGKTSDYNVYVPSGKVTLNYVDIQGSAKENIHLEGSGAATVNDATLGATTSKANTKLIGESELTLNRVTIDGTESGDGYILCAEGKKATLNTVTIKAGPIGKNNKFDYVGLWVKNDCEVQATDITCNGMRRGVIVNSGQTTIKGLTSTKTKECDVDIDGGTVAIEDLNKNVTTQAKVENISAGLSLAGTINASITNDAAVSLNATTVLAGDVDIQWTEGKEPADKVAIQFTAESDAEASMPYVALAGKIAEKYDLLLSGKQILLSTGNYIVKTYDELQTALNKIALNDVKEPTITVAGNIVVEGLITIPAGYKVTITDDETARSITRSSAYTSGNIFEVVSGATLTLDTTTKSNADDKVMLIVDGGSANGITTTGESSLIKNNGTLNVSSGVKLANNASTDNVCGLGIYATSGSDTTFEGILSNISGTNSGDNANGSAFVIDGTTAVIQNALIKGNTVQRSGVVLVTNGGNLTVTNSKFESNKSLGGDAGAIQINGAESKLSVDKCTFTENKAKANGGAIAVFCETEDNVIVKNSTFKGNEAAGGGAITIGTGHKLTVENCVFEDNKGTSTDKGRTAGTGDIRLGGAGATKLKVSGKFVGTVYQNQASRIYITGALTEGSDLTVDWRNDHNMTNKVGIEFSKTEKFSSTEIMNASKPFISLGGNHNKKLALKYNAATDSVGANATLVGTTEIKSLDEFENAVSTSEGKTVFLRLKTDLEIDSRITLPENSDITILDDGEEKTIKRSSGYTGYLFTVPTSSKLTLISTSNDNGNPTLIVDGGSKDDDTGIKCEEGCTLLDNHGTLSVRAGVQLSNNYGTVAAQGFGIYSRKNSTTIFSGVISNITGTNSKASGSAIAVEGTVTLRNAVIKDCYAGANGGAIAIVADATGNVTIIDSKFIKNTSKVCGGAISIEQNAKGTMTITNCEFSESSSQWGGVIQIDKNSTVDFTVDGCTFSDNSATGNAGVINVDNLVDKNIIKNSIFDGNSASNEGSSISVRTSGYLTLENCEFTNGTTSTSTNNSKCGYGDVRVADNRNGGNIRISGKMIVDIYMNQAGKITVSDALAKDSDVVANWRLDRITAVSWPGITFASEDVMNASKDYISLSKNYSDTYELSFSGTQGILNKK